ncbi:sodium:proton antiporter isoform B [Micractinium conductrix]|uniref:Sodium:proton antiporter isoform B n=1 Tax=Micractinium conductrix TaxID=554055 RepID=A0A2P6VE79_9CHLO|nr:sodium:proton antiporter isoform B [Micractinium conductrix]|eukprot:PSC72405.1 sodium:proton antiporter isoform B [Micractinium conductrix]
MSLTRTTTEWAPSLEGGEGLADDDVMPSSTTASPTKSMGATAAEVENEETVPICPACGKAAIIINK